LRKMRGDSNWKGLTFEQCQKVEEWLFEENRCHAEVAARVKQQFGVETSRWSVGRFYRHRVRMRQSLELVEAQVASDQLSAMPAKTEDMRAAAIKLMAKTAVKLATEKPEELEQLTSLAKVLLESEQNEIRLRRVKLEERYYDFEANTACAKELEKVRAYPIAVGDNENLSAKDKHDRVVELLFGKDTVNPEEAEAAESEIEEVEENEAEAAPLEEEAGQPANNPAENEPSAPADSDGEKGAANDEKPS
jgi:hypothetical protein